MGCPLGWLQGALPQKVASKLDLEQVLPGRKRRRGIPGRRDHRGRAIPTGRTQVSLELQRAGGPEAHVGWETERSREGNYWRWDQRGPW